MALSRRLLRPGGSLVAKVWRGGEEADVLREARQLFERARLSKPKASRSASSEIFLVARGLRDDATARA